MQTIKFRAMRVAGSPASLLGHFRADSTKYSFHQPCAADCVPRAQLRALISLAVRAFPLTLEKLFALARGGL